METEKYRRIGGMARNFAGIAAATVTLLGLAGCLYLNRGTEAGETGLEASNEPQIQSVLSACKVFKRAEQERRGE